MRKITFLLLFFVGGFWLNAQVSYQLLDLQGLDITNDTITVNGLVSDNEVYFYAHVKNTTSSSKTTVCKKTVVTTDGSNMNMFCFGTNCYNGTTSNLVTIGAGVTDTTFDGYVFPSGVVGVTSVLYTFYNNQDMADSINVFVRYNLVDASAVSLGNLNTTYLNKPFPLPANDFVKFDYRLGQGDIAAVVFYDILGTEVGRYFLSSGLNQIKINTSELKTGVFIYALIVNGKKTKMGRIMIRH